MKIQRQPTKTSCGPTCVAMTVGRPVAEILELVPDVRRSACRQRMRNHRTNVGEIKRLLGYFGVSMGPRRREGAPLILETSLALLRIARPIGRGWHWAVWYEGKVWDPLHDAPRALSTYAHREITWYRLFKTGSRG